MMESKGKNKSVFSPDLKHSDSQGISWQTVLKLEQHPNAACSEILTEPVLYLDTILVKCERSVKHLICLFVYW